MEEKDLVYFYFPKNKIYTVSLQDVPLERIESFLKNKFPTKNVGNVVRYSWSSAKYAKRALVDHVRNSGYPYTLKFIEESDGEFILTDNWKNKFHLRIVNEDNLKSIKGSMKIMPEDTMYVTESTFTRVTDLAYAVRFLRLLTTPWEKTGAYEHGIIDKNGKPIKKARNLTRDEKTYYNLFHRLVFSIKRLITKIPFIGRHIATSYAAALLLIKDHTGLDDEALKEILYKATGEPILPDLIEHHSPLTCDHLTLDRHLKRGTYTLRNDTMSITNCEYIVQGGSQLRLRENVESCGDVFGIPVYKVKHDSSGQWIYVSSHDIQEIS